MLIYLFYSKILASYSFIITQFDKRKHPASLQGACIPIGFCTGISDPSLNTPSTACTKYLGELLAWISICCVVVHRHSHCYASRLRLAAETSSCVLLPVLSCTLYWYKSNAAAWRAGGLVQPDRQKFVSGAVSLQNRFSYREGCGIIRLYVR